VVTKQLFRRWKLAVAPICLLVGWLEGGCSIDNRMVQPGATGGAGLGGGAGSTGASGGSQADAAAGADGDASAGSDARADTVDVVPGNLIVNGDFSEGYTDWNLTIQGGPTGSSADVSTGALCLTLMPAVSVTLGWPSDPASSAVLSAGVNYRLSYQVSASLPLSLETKVGLAVSPYDPVDFDVTNEMPGTELQEFTHVFSPAQSDPMAGLAFNFVAQASYNAQGPVGTTVCFDNISLVALDGPPDSGGTGGFGGAAGFGGTRAPRDADGSGGTGN
jgi:hypothetical protein